MNNNFNPLAKVTADMMLRPIPIIQFEDAKFDLYMISGFLTEKWYLPYGTHSVTLGELANSDWLRYLIKLAQTHDFNLYFYNWAAQSLTHRDPLFFDVFNKFFNDFSNKYSENFKNQSYETKNSTNFTLPIDEYIASLDIQKEITKMSPFWMRSLIKSSQILESIKPRILTKWNDALEATIPSAIELDKAVVSTHRKTLLLGHSLGGRIALKTMEFAHINNLHHISCIALAPAIRCSELNLQLMNSRSNKIEVFFSEFDMVLSLIYRFAELTSEKPIGLQGSQSIISREINYSKRHKKFIGHTDYEANIISLLLESEIFKEYIST